jgi:hypothetical protein
MARGTTAAEREGATVLLTADGEPVLDDIEQSFDDWRGSFDNAETPGTITALQLPLDERGLVSPTSKAQTRLGAWPIDMYSYHELCAMLIREFMVPANEKLIAVRLIGTRAGQRGFSFNKIVIIRAPASAFNGGMGATQAGGSETVAGIAKLLAEMQQQNLALLERLNRPPPTPPPVDQLAEIQKLALISEMLNKGSNRLMELVVPALIGRPAPAAAGNPFDNITGLLDVAEKLSELKSGSGDGDGGDSWVGILKALAPVAKPALETIAETVRRMPAAAPPALPRPAPQPTAQPTAPSAPTQSAAQPAGSLTDIPSGDREVFAQLKPQIDSLVQMAGQGADPVAAADLLFDQVILTLPDQVYEQIVNVVTSPSFLKNAAVFNPAVNQHADFFEKFRAQIEKRVTDEDAAAGMEPSS